jgi:hypothetical protein
MNGRAGHGGLGVPDEVQQWMARSAERVSSQSNLSTRPVAWVSIATTMSISSAALRPACPPDSRPTTMASSTSAESGSTV